MSAHISYKEIVIPLIVAMFSIACPLLLGVIQRIDEKYNSTRIFKQFQSECLTKIFIKSLIFTIVGLFLAPIIPCIKYVVIIFCIILVICLLKIIQLICLYYNPAQLQERLLRQCSNYSSKEKELRNVWLELFSAMLEKDNIEELEQSFQALYKWVENIRQDDTYKIVEYPKELYNGILILNEKLCGQKKQIVSPKNKSDFLRIFLDKEQKTFIHSKTFNVMWICLNQQLYYGRQDWIMTYWSSAHEYYLYTLKNHTEKTYEQLIETHQKEFKYFHIALCSLLLYKNEYSLLQKIINYSDTQPPQYVLIPSHYGEIISLFMNLVASDEGRKMTQYSFFDLQQGVRNENITNGWIQKYLVFLMFRLVILERNSEIKEDYSSFRAFPPRLSGKEEWLENISVLKQRIEDEIMLETTTQILLLEQKEIEQQKNKLLDAVNGIETKLRNSINNQ